MFLVTTYVLLGSHPCVCARGVHHVILSRLLVWFVLRALIPLIVQSAVQYPRREGVNSHDDASYNHRIIP